MASKSLDVKALQSEMVQPAVSHASNIVKEYLKFPDLSMPETTDVHELRSQILQMKAKLKEYANKAESACYEVERRHRAEKNKSPDRKSSVITGKVSQQSKRPQEFQQPTPEASPIPLLEAINNLVTAEEEEEGWDLLKDDVKRRGTHTTVGIRLGQNSSAHDLKPLQIQIVIPGSSAHICGLLTRGDEIIAVDGQPVTERDIVEKVRGSDVVGTKVVLTIRQFRTNKCFDVALVRGAWGSVERKEKLFILFEEVIKLLNHNAPTEEILVSLHRIVDQAKEYEKYRAVSEMKIQDRLSHLQGEMKRLIKDCTKKCEALLAMYSGAVNALHNQIPELTVELHERVEQYIKDLQRQLHESEVRNADLTAKAEAAAKWMEAIKGMEALAAFSRRKIRNWEKIYTPNQAKKPDNDDD